MRRSESSGNYLIEEKGDRYRVEVFLTSCLHREWHRDKKVAGEKIGE
jgi:hypothetical protein